MPVKTDYQEFDARDYLQEYYADVGPENVALLRFLVQSFRDLPPAGCMLDFGGGPTLYCLIAAADRVGEVHLADYAQGNLDQVQSWLRGDALAFQWHAFTRAILELEGDPTSPDDVLAREERARARCTRVMTCDAHAACPVEQAGRQYDVVTTNFCAEAAARDRAQWRACMRNIISLLRPGGKLIVSAVKGAESYGVGAATFLAVNLLEEDLRRMLLEAGFLGESIVMDSVPADRPDRHYQGLMFAAAVKGPQEERVDG